MFPVEQKDPVATHSWSVGWNNYHPIQVCFKVYDVRVYFKENKFMNNKSCVSMSSNVSRTSKIQQEDIPGLLWNDHTVYTEKC